MAHEQRIVIYGIEPILEVAGGRVAQEVELLPVEEAESGPGYLRRGQSRPVSRLVEPLPGQQVGIRVGYAVLRGDDHDRPGQQQVCTEELEILFSPEHESFSDEEIAEAVKAASVIALGRIPGSPLDTAATSINRLLEGPA
jgi:hypothetical protein